MPGSRSRARLISARGRLARRAPIVGVGRSCRCTNNTRWRRRWAFACLRCRPKCSRGSIGFFSGRKAMRRADNVDPYDNPWRGMDGKWYWYDESSDEHGPYETLQAAMFALRARAKMLTYGPGPIPNDYTPWIVLPPIELEPDAERRETWREF